MNQKLRLIIGGQSYLRSEIASFHTDCQYTFTSECPEQLPVPGALEIVKELNKNAEFPDSIITASGDCHSPVAKNIATKKLPQFSTEGLEEYPNLDIRWKKHGTHGTKGEKLLKGLPRPMEYSYFVWKGMDETTHPYGACYHDLHDRMSTGLIEYLKCKGTKVVIVGGLATDYCVKTTVLQLIKAGFVVILNLASCRGIGEDTTEAAIEEMRESGAIIVQNAVEIEAMMAA